MYYEEGGNSFENWVILRILFFNDVIFVIVCENESKIGFK